MYLSRVMSKPDSLGRDGFHQWKKIERLNLGHLEQLVKMAKFFPRREFPAIRYIKVLVYMYLLYTHSTTM